MEVNFTTRQAAEYLKSIGAPGTEKTLEVWRCQGRGPQYKRIGRRVRYTKNSLDKFAEGEVVHTVDSMAYQEVMA